MVTAGGYSAMAVQAEPVERAEMAGTALPVLRAAWVV
ncbi:hypothetical protein MGAST_20550 [Mycobacterium gastri 'Wayne']|nr:hypothetical protein MGAST_20550 [Mycobacterium gastri 'Wayne']